MQYWCDKRKLATSKMDAEGKVFNWSISSCVDITRHTLEKISLVARPLLKITFPTIFSELWDRLMTGNTQSLVKATDCHLSCPYAKLKLSIGQLHLGLAGLGHGQVQPPVDAI